MMARQAFKLMTYLNDVPSHANDTDIYRLFLNEERKEAKNIKELFTFCAKQGLFTELYVDKVESKDGSLSENLIDVAYSNEGAAVRLNATLLHKLILDALRLQDGGVFVVEGIRQLAEQREALISEIEEIESSDLGESENMARRKFFEDYMLHKLNGSLPLQQLMRDWFYSYGQQLKNEQKLRYALLEKLQEEPVLPRYHDFYFEENEKPRNSDRFSEFAVKYLMDFELVPEWEWMMERFDVAEKDGLAKSGKEKGFFGKLMPGSGWRLSVTEGSVIVRLRRLPELRFQFGHRAVKNLLVAHFHKNAKLANLLTDLTKDAQKINMVLQDKAAASLSDMRVLERKNLPRYILLALGDAKALEGETTESAKKATLKRIANLVEKLRAIRENSVGMPRNEKNRIVMDCYQLFDWHYPHDSAYKFLRRNEYQDMSIYHYMLERILHLNNDIVYFEASLKERELDFKKKGKLKMLLRGAKQEIEKTQSILDKLRSSIGDRIPKEVGDILDNADSLDELLKQATTSAIIRLSEWQLDIEKGDNDIFEAVRQKLGIRKPVSAVNAEVKKKWTHRQNGHFWHHVHPDVILHYFYKDELASGQSNSTHGFSLSMLVRGSEDFISGLRSTHYNYAPYLETLETDNVAEKAILHKVIKVNNQQLVNDGLLWKVAQAYMGKVNPVIQDVLSTQLNRTGKMRVEGLHKAELFIPVSTPGGNIALKLFFHQLDDILLFESKTMLEKATAHLLRHMIPELKAKLIEGTMQLPYIELLNEIRRINHQSLEFAHYILQFERNIVKNQNHKTLPPFQKFADICRTAKLTEEQSLELTDMRNHAFHNKIPTEWNYNDKREIPWLRSVLKIIEKEPVDYEAKAIDFKKAAL